MRRLYKRVRNLKPALQVGLIIVSVLSLAGLTATAYVINSNSNKSDSYSEDTNIADGGTQVKEEVSPTEEVSEPEPQQENKPGLVKPNEEQRSTSPDESESNSQLPQKIISRVNVKFVNRTWTCGSTSPCTTAIDYGISFYIIDLDIAKPVRYTSCILRAYPKSFTIPEGFYSSTYSLQNDGSPPLCNATLKLPRAGQYNIQYEAVLENAVLKDAPTVKGFFGMLEISQ